MKRTEVFKSSTFKGEDLQPGETLTLQITGDELIEFTDGNGKPDPKLCLHFKNEEKALAINQTNWDFLEDALEKTDSADWVGAFIVIERVKVKVRGETKAGLRITKAAFPKKKLAGNPATQAKVAPPPTPKEEVEQSDADEESPF